MNILEQRALDRRRAAQKTIVANMNRERFDAEQRRKEYDKIFDAWKTTVQQLEARNAARPSTELPTFKKSSEGERAAESPAATKKITLEESTSNKVQSKKTKSGVPSSWDRLMANFGVNVDNIFVDGKLYDRNQLSSDIVNSLTDNFARNFIPSTVNVRYGDQIPASRQQHKMLALREIELNTKDIDDKIKDISERKTNEIIASNPINGTSSEENAFLQSRRDRLIEDTLNNDPELQNLRKQKALIELNVREQLDPDEFTVGWLSQFQGSPLQAKKQAHEDAIEGFEILRQAYKDGSVSREEVLSSANQLQNATREYAKLVNKYNALNHYIRTFGLPNSFLDMPTNIKNTLSELIPGIDSDPDNIKTFKSFIEDYIASQQDLRVNAAVSAAKNAPEATINEQQLLDMRRSVRLEKEAIEMLSGADLAPWITMSTSPGMVVDYTQGVKNIIASSFDANYKSYQEAERIIEKAQRYADLGKKVKATNKFWATGNLKNMGYGAAEVIREKLADPFGIEELGSTITQLGLMNKINSGEDLTSGDRSLMDALALNQAIHNKYSDLEDVGGYKFANIATNSLAFMAEFMATNAALNAIAKKGTRVVEREVAGQVTRSVERSTAAKVADFILGHTGDRMMQETAYHGMESLGREGVRTALAKYAHKTPGFLTKVGGDAVKALLMETTIQLPRTLSDINQLHLGTVGYTTDSEGNVTGTEFSGGLNWGKSIYTAGMRDWIENFSEQMGEWGIGHLLGRGMSALGKQAVSKMPSLGKLAEVFSRGGQALEKIRNRMTTKGFRDTLAAGEYSGIFGETAEEYYGMILQHLTGTSDSGKDFWDDLTSKDNFIDIVGGIGLSQVFLGTFGVVGHLRAQHQYNSAKADSKAHFGDKWEAIENAMVMSDQANLPAVVTSLMQVYRSKDDIDQIMRYYDALCRYRGASYAAQSEYDDLMKSIHQQTLDESHATGFSMSSVQLRKDVDRAVRIAESELQRVFDEDPSVIQQAVEDGGGIDRFLDGYDLSPEQRQVALTYANLLEMKAGADTRLMYDMEAETNRIRRGINRVTYGYGERRTSDPSLQGKVILINYKDKDGNNRQGYVLGGDFSYREIPGGRKNDDTGQYEPAYTIRANGNLSVRDQNTGELVTVANEQLDSLDAIAPADIIVSRELDDYHRSWKAMDKRLEESRGVRIGQKLEFENGDELTVVSSSADGGMIYSIRDKESGEEHLYHADSQQSMNDILEDAQDKRAMRIHDNVAQVIRQRLAARAKYTPGQMLARRDAAVAATDRLIQDVVNERAEESAKRVTDHIEIGNSSMWSKKNAKGSFDRIKRLSKQLKSAESFDEFKALLKGVKLLVDSKYDGRLRALYNALRNGNISSAQFAAVFIPEGKRASILSKRQLSSFNNLEIDADGNVTTTRRSRPNRAQQPKVDISTSPEYLIPSDIDDEPIQLPTTPATPTGAVAAANESQHPAQQQAADKLRLHIATQGSTVQRQWTSGQHYFFKVGDTIKIYRRVHSVLDDQYEPRIEQAGEVSKLVQELTNLYNSDRAKFEETVKSLDSEANFEGYLEYLKQKDADVQDAIDGIARSAVEKATSVSIKYGQLIDELGRKIFGGELVLYADYSNVMSEDTFNDIIRQARQWKSAADAMGWQLITTPTVFYAEVYDNESRKVVSIAGETDMIAIDQNGKYHVVDFKTSYKNFTPENFDVTPTRRLDNYRSAKRSTREQYSRQQTMYSLMMLNNLGQNAESISIMPWVVKYDYNGPFYLKGAKNEINGKPQLIYLMANDYILGRFESADVVTVANLTNTLFLQQMLINGRTDFLAELAVTYPECVDDEVKQLMTSLNRLLEDYRQLNEMDDPTIPMLHSTRDLGEKILSAASDIVDVIERKALELAVATSHTETAIANTQNLPKPVENAQSDEEWRNRTTTHVRSANGYTGIEDAAAEDNLDLKLRSVTGNPDFIRNAKFKFIMKDGRVHVQVTYNGHTYQPVSISTAHNELGRIFYRNVKMLFSKLTPGKAIVLSTPPSRTNGTIRVGQRGLLSDKGLVTTDRKKSGVYLYDVQLGNGDTTFGVIVEEGGRHIVGIPGQARRSRDVVMTYPEGSSPADGGVVMMVRRPYEELPESRQPKVPINLYNTKMTTGDADLILGILTGEYARDKSGGVPGVMKQVFYQNGVNMGLTNELVLNMLIAYGSYNRKAKPHVHIQVDRYNGHVVHIVGNVKGDPTGEIADRKFDLSSAEGKESLKTFLMENVTRNLDLTLMQSRLGSISDKQNLLYGLSEFFHSKAGQKIVSQHGALKFGNSSLVFDAKDFRDESNPADKAGLSGLGWYIRHGFVESDFEGFENTLLEFDHNAALEIVDETQEQARENAPTTVENEIEQAIINAVENGVEEYDPLNDPTLFDNPTDVEDMGLIFRTMREGEVDESVDIEAAKVELRRMLGDDFDIEVFDGFIARFKDGIVAVGACVRDAIWLSKKAVRGTEYHEAFHRITEVVFTPKQRERLFRMYRNAKKRKDLTDKEVAEAMADDFMYFAENRPTFKGAGNIFKRIWNYIRGINKIGGFRLFWLYRNVYKGKYANRSANPDSVLTPGQMVYKLIKRGASFNEIATQHQYKVLVNSLCAILLNEKTQVVRWDGTNVSDLKIDRDTLIKSPGFKAYYAKASGETKMALKELLTHWSEVEPDIAGYISTFATSFKVKYEEQQDKSREGSSDEVPVVDNTGDVDDVDFDEEIASASNEEHMKASYEFSQFSRTSEKVKFFFSGVIKTVWSKDKDGNLVHTPVLNEYGLPVLLDPKWVFSTVLSEMHDCTSLTEFMNRLKQCGLLDSTFDTVYKRFVDLYNQAYPQNGSVDYDAEQTLVQIFSTIRSQKNSFEIVRSSKDVITGGQTLNVFSSDAGHSARNYTEDWSSQFAAGGSRYIEQDKDGNFVMRGQQTPDIFAAIYNIFYGQGSVNTAYSTEGRQKLDDPNYKKFVLLGTVIDVSNPSHVEATKRLITRQLRAMGILIEQDVFNYMLLHKYGNAGVEGMTKFMQDRSESSFFSYCNFIRGFVVGGKLNLATDKNGAITLNGQRVNQIFNKNGFIKELASQKYNYRVAHDQLSVLATNNNKYYVISENNIMSDRVSELENGGTERDQLFDTPYVLTETEDGAVVGSLMAKHVLHNGHTPLRMATLAGFRTDEKGDLGSDYAMINRREDYMAKMTILLHRVKDPITGETSTPILFPTLSDKKTWCYIYGVNLPGIDFGNVREYVKRVNGAPQPFINSVVDQFIEYAISEDAGVKQVLDSYNKLSPEERVVNFHEGAKITDRLGATYSVVQGARYHSMLGVYTIDGTFVEFNRTLDDAGVYQSEQQCYNIAHKYFFDAQEVSDNGIIRMETPEETRERQRGQIRMLLAKQMEEELRYAEELGLIEKVEGETNPMFMYRNVGLDSKLIYSIEQQFRGSNNNTTIEQNRKLHAYATYLVIADTMTRHMMSMQEVERMFSGNPSAYKFKYDKAGHLVDRTVDQQKRLGGLVSTGTNNVAIPGIPEEYTVAEVDNEMIQAPEIESIEKIIYEGLVRQAAIRQFLTKNSYTFDQEFEDKEESDAFRKTIEEIESKPLKEVEEMLSETTLTAVKKTAEAKTNAFKKDGEKGLDGIDVADGGSYISDKMCENLLRMVGSYNNEVAKAFKILRGEEVDGRTYTIKDTAEIAKAYHTILTTVIGTLKYTAFGFRYVDGSAIPYYNKTALFPLFKNICTGKMAKIYKKMQDDGLDMLMVNSSVKVGSLGSKSDEWNSETVDFNDPNGFHFNAYKQKYAYLRKQFNTDPREKEIMSMGTQMTKIALSTLLPGRMYNVGGVQMSGTQLRDHIMDSLKKMSDEGVAEIKKMFFDESGIFDVEKFSKTITKELQSRNASAEMLDAVSVVERNGRKELKLPLAALSGMNWIQSIIKSMVDKRVVDTNTPGKAFYQRSAWNMEGPTTVLDDDDLPQALNNGNRLLMKNEEGSMDCVLSIDYFEDILKNAKVKTGRKIKKQVKKTRKVPATSIDRYGRKTTDYTHLVDEEYTEEIEVDEKVSVSTLSFNEQKQWLIDHDIISGMKNGEWHHATASLIGYRIPTQAISSIHALRCVDVIPTVRDTIILPAEFTKITGSDKHQCSNVKKSL